MSQIEYHLNELSIGQSPDDPRHIMPPLPERYSRVLDLGCGLGQTLINLPLKENTLAVGVDIDEEALAYGRQLHQRLLLARADCEHLPFPAESFDFIFSRVALPYTHLPTSLKEIFRVLQPGQSVWFTMHPMSIVLQQLFLAIRTLNAKNIIFQIYIIVNSLLFHLVGMMFRFPLKKNRCESFQTSRGMRRGMRLAGFTQIQITRGKFFILTAVKNQQESKG